MHIIIATHGQMARGLYHASEILYGKKANLSFLEAYVHSDDFEEELKQLLKTINTREIIVLTDLLGGSVNQVMMRYQGEKHLKIVTGTNLALLLRVLAVNADEDLSAQLRNCVKKSQEQLIFINELLNK